MNPSTQIIPIYDIANNRFKNVELKLKNGNIYHGQFVHFTVLKGMVETYFPQNDFCFLLSDNQRDFWEKWNTSGGKFEEIPEYMKFIKYPEVKEIIIRPV